MTTAGRNTGRRMVELFTWPFIANPFSLTGKLKPCVMRTNFIFSTCEGLNRFKLGVSI